MINSTLSERQDVECSVFDISGRRIATVVNEHYMPGIHRITWGFHPIAQEVVTLYIQKQERIPSNKMITSGKQM